MLIHYAQDLVSLFETSEFRKVYQTSRVSHPFHVQKHYSMVQLQFKSYGWSSQSNRARNRSPDARLSHRGVGQGDEAHASGAEAHVTAQKCAKEWQRRRAKVQRRTPLYRGATPHHRGARLSSDLQKAPPLWHSGARLSVRAHASVAQKSVPVAKFDINS